MPSGGLIVSGRDSGLSSPGLRDIVLYSWARHFTLTVLLSNLGTGIFNAGGNPAIDWCPMQGGVEIPLVAS